jgi:hypothetical protein
MKTYLLGSFSIVGLASQVSAAPTSNPHFAVINTVGHCAVVDTLPSKVSGLRILGDKAGYKSEANARKGWPWM